MLRYFLVPVRSSSLHPAETYVTSVFCKEIRKFYDGDPSIIIILIINKQPKHLSKNNSVQLYSAKETIHIISLESISKKRAPRSIH